MGSINGPKHTLLLENIENDVGYLIIDNAPMLLVKARSKPIWCGKIQMGHLLEGIFYFSLSVSFVRNKVHSVSNSQYDGTGTMGNLFTGGTARGENQLSRKNPQTHFEYV